MFLTFLSQTSSPLRLWEEKEVKNKRELGRPMIVVLNKMDALKRERQMINVSELEKTLGTSFRMEYSVRLSD